MKRLRVGYAQIVSEGFYLPERVTEAATFEACYAVHRRRVYGWCLRLGGGDTSFAEDVTHDVFVKLLVRLPHLDAQDDLGGWLYRVAVNAALRRLRREQSFWKRFLASHDDASPQPSPAELVERSEDAAAALLALRELPARERIVLGLKLIDGKSQREIAELLSMSEGYVSKLCARAWVRLRAAGWEDDDAA